MEVNMGMGILTTVFGFLTRSSHAGIICKGSVRASWLPLNNGWVFSSRNAADRTMTIAFCYFPLGTYALWSQTLNYNGCPSWLVGGYDKEIYTPSDYLNYGGFDYFVTFTTGPNALAYGGTD